jgi:hypothetical protein
LAVFDASHVGFYQMKPTPAQNVNEAMGTLRARRRITAASECEGSAHASQARRRTVFYMPAWIR